MRPCRLMFGKAKTMATACDEYDAAYKLLIPFFAI